jgi:hypothetical protein
MKSAKKNTSDKKKLRIPSQKVDATKFWRQVLSQAEPLFDAHDRVLALSLSEAHNQIFW